jgi:glycosyltransferase involved in cell wall biosynthesis
MTVSPPTLSIVVASRDRPEMLQHCIASINRCRAPDAELIVVDSASSDRGRVARIARLGGARLVRSELPGAARARNLGLAGARGDIIAFTDDDATVDPGWADALRNAFSDPVVDAVVGPVFLEGTSPPFAMHPRTGIDPAIDRVRFSRANQGWFDEVSFGSIGFGANLAVRRGAFNRFGTFRECLGAGAPIAGDENYFLLTLVARGATVMNEPRARVFHPPQTPGRIRELQRSAVAYLLYVIGTQPGLAPRTAARILRRIMHRSRGGVRRSPAGPAGARAREILEAALAAPGLLLAARQFGQQRTATISMR